MEEQAQVTSRFGFAEVEEDRVNRALVIVYEGATLGAAYSADNSMRELMIGCGAMSDCFDLQAMNIESDVPKEDGVYVSDIVAVDDGPGDWPGSRETIPALKGTRKATKEEWLAHCRGEWPWVPNSPTGKTG